MAQTQRGPPSWVNSGRGLELQKLPRRTTNSSPRPLESRAGTHPQSSPEPGWRNLRLLSRELAGWAAPGFPLVLLPLAPGCFLGWRCCPTAWQPHSFCLGSSLWFAKLGWEQILQKQAHSLFSRLRNSSQLGIENPNTGCTKLLRTHRPAFTGGSQRFCLRPVREARRAQAGFRDAAPEAGQARPPFSRSRFPALHGPLTAARARDRLRAGD